jgi:hypothetical protein
VAKADADHEHQVDRAGLAIGRRRRRRRSVTVLQVRRIGRRRRRQEHDHSAEAGDAEQQPALERVGDALDEAVRLEEVGARQPPLERRVREHAQDELVVLDGELLEVDEGSE